jgi:uncharacterized protein (TIGR02284 family)
MLRSVSELTGYSILATDGQIGKVAEFYFDDITWTIRYLVVDTGNWLVNQKVLISALVLGQPEGQTRQLSVDLTQKQVENAPSIDLDRPVSRQHEIALHDYYGWPWYWISVPGGVYPLGVPPVAPSEIIKDEEDELEEKEPPEEQRADPHLRSTAEVMGYHIAATDGEIGHVEDFIVDDESWTIHYMVVDTRNWLPGKKVLLSPAWIDLVSWPELRVHIGVTQERVKNSPEYDPSIPVNREDGTRLYDFYGRPQMIMKEFQTIGILNALIRTCRAGQLVFETAAKDVRFALHRELFEYYAQQRAEYMTELAKAVERLGGDPEQSGRIPGMLHRGWMEVKATATGDDGGAMLKECERGEALALEQYEMALKEEWPAEIRSILSRQYKAIKEVYDHIHQLQQAKSQELSR